MVVEVHAVFFLDDKHCAGLFQMLQKILESGH